MRIMMLRLFVLLLFFSASAPAREAEEYSVILVNSFNESDFEVKTYSITLIISYKI